MQTEAKVLILAVASVISLVLYFAQPVEQPVTGLTQRKKKDRLSLDLKPQYERVERIDGVITRPSLVKVLKAVRADLSVRLVSLKRSCKELRRERFHNQSAYAGLLTEYLAAQSRELDASLAAVLVASNTDSREFQQAMDRHGAYHDVISEFCALRKEAFVCPEEGGKATLDRDVVASALETIIGHLKQGGVQTRPALTLSLWTAYDSLFKTSQIDEDELLSSAQFWTKSDLRVRSLLSELDGTLEGLLSCLSFEELV